MAIDLFIFLDNPIWSFSLLNYRILFVSVNLFKVLFFVIYWQNLKQ